MSDVKFVSLILVVSFISLFTGIYVIDIERTRDVSQAVMERSDKVNALQTNARSTYQNLRVCSDHSRLCQE